MSEGERIPKSHMDFVDKLYWTPDERASAILAMLNNMRNHLRRDNIKNKRHPGEGIPTDWDFICFGIEYTGAKAVALNDPVLLELIVPLIRWLHATHYSNPSRIYGPPDRDDNATVQDQGSEQEAPVHPSDQRRGDDPGSGDHAEPRAPEGEGGGDRVGDHDGSRNDPG